MSDKNFIIIALGSNLGDKKENLVRGFKELRKKINNITCSNIYETQALLPEGAPEGWDKLFYNCVFYGATELNISELHQFCLDTEKNFTTQKQKGSWAPRFLDVDILAFNNEIIKSDTLEIPHARMLERSFVIWPLAEIMPDWVHPLTEKKISEHKKIFPENDQLEIRRLDLGLYD